ncbi:Triose phosphate/phosphate translocator, chloroplastic [Glycine soja]|uniref:Triose phosphate/phosphate translocator, chloroplastic n=1 Tax=Glycine soja TaxID=3848 RepID=A0A445F0U3_GLYSO|nr:Triose phosphate/phosphate translocator, chloroplastic [Glycine soja]
MESRVRSRTGTLSSLPHLRKPPREVGAGPSLVTVKAVGSVANDGNLFWVRQLRPKLCSPALKKEAFLLRPCLVIAGRGQEAKVSPAGFFEKYPALVTGFFFFTCYVTSRDSVLCLLRSLSLTFNHLTVFHEE